MCYLHRSLCIENVYCHESNVFDDFEWTADKII